MKVLENGTIIKIGTVEGTSTKKGSKQNTTYTITSNAGIVTVNGVECDHRAFYTAISDKGKVVKIWNINRDFSKLGINREGLMRMTYTENFEIITK